MESLVAMISVLDYSLDTRRKQHIAGGILLSVSLLFGVLAFTTMTLQTKENCDEC